MGTQENLAKTRAAFAAFAAGDGAAAIGAWATDGTIVLNGDSAIAGTVRGHAEIGALFGRLGAKGFAITPNRFVADGDTVIVFCAMEVGGEKADVVEVVDFNDDPKVQRAEIFGGEDLLRRVYG